MRGIRATFELDNNGVKSLDRYSIVTGDGVDSVMFALADPLDRYSTGIWTSLLGEAKLSVTSATDRSGGMYVNIDRVFPNPNFAFDPLHYHYTPSDWLLASLDACNFRLYNPFIGRPNLTWPRGLGWGDSVPFSEGDTQSFSYTIYNYDLKINRTVDYTVTRLPDSNDYKEFVVRLSV